MKKIEKLKSIETVERERERERELDLEENVGKIVEE